MQNYPPRLPELEEKKAENEHKKSSLMLSTQTNQDKFLMQQQRHDPSSGSHQWSVTSMFVCLSEPKNMLSRISVMFLLSVFQAFTLLKSVCEKFMSRQECVFVSVCVYYLWIQVRTESRQVVQNDYTFFCCQLAECWARSDTPTQQRKTAERDTEEPVTHTLQFHSCVQLNCIKILYLRKRAATTI